jgi:RNA polymerase sigma-70 factor (ECF subfamily)
MPELKPLLDAARAGDTAALGELLARFQPWLHLLARLEVDSRFQGKFDPSDLVQQTQLEACRSIAQFRGQNEAELAGWLRQILAHVMAHEVRRFEGTLKRDMGREVSIDEELAASSGRLRTILADTGTSPSQQAIRHEDEIRLAQVLARLPDDYREVLILRHLGGLSHEAIAKRMQRGQGAVRMLWVRALARLREEMLANEV